ncbi:MAG: hypothetical protein WBX22_18075 [Silvibacterium sp.]
MTYLLDHPILVFAISLLILWFAALTAAFFRGKLGFELAGDIREDFNVILAATLTLLGLIIGFSFSMATTRYDLRKSLEESEANAIGTQYVRADLLPQADAAQVRALLRQYTDLRIAYYKTRDRDQLQQINRDTAQLQNRLWAAIAGPATAQPTPVRALAVSGMNDVLNSQGYTQAAWWNRIPTAAWGMMTAIAIVSNVLLGVGSHRTKAALFVVVPMVVAVSFMLIADIDSPRGGVIRVHPQNLESLRAALSNQ